MLTIAKQSPLTMRCAGSGTLPLPLKKLHWGFFLTRLRVPLSYINKGAPIGAPLVPVAGLEPSLRLAQGAERLENATVRRFQQGRAKPMGAALKPHRGFIHFRARFESFIQ